MKKICIILNLLLIYSITGISQSNRIDSLTIALSQAKNDTGRILIMIQIAESYFRIDNEKVEVYTKHAIELSDQTGFILGKVRALNLLGAAYHAEGQYDSAMVVYREGMDLATSNNLQGYICKITYNIGLVFQKRGNFEIALEYFFEARKENISGNLQIEFATLNSIATIYRSQGKFQSAANVFFQASNVPGLPEYQKAGLNNNLGTLYISIGKLDSAKYFLESALPAFEKIGDKGSQLLVITNLAKLEVRKKKYTESLKYFKQGDLLIASQNTSPSDYMERESVFRMTKAEVFYEIKKYNEAINEATIVNNISKSSGSLIFLRDAYAVLGKSYSALGNFNNAYSSFLKLSLVKDSLNKIQDTEKIAELESKFELDKSKLQIAQLEKEKNLQARLENYLIILIVLILATGVLIISRQRLKISTNKKLIEVLKATENSEKKNSQLTSEALEKEVEYKNKELAARILSLVHKNEIIDEIRSGLSSLLKKKPEISKRDVNGILNLIFHSVNVDKDWKEFSMYFEQVHKNFFANLSTQFSGLSPSDLKLCALTKLDLTTAKAANILGISTESVKMARYRLRKKLNLSTDQTLNAFFEHF